MTIEEKAKAYDEALDRCKEWASGILGHSVDDSPKDIAEFIFPQLAESEDERIRKALIWHLKADADFVSNGMTKAECIAYLEKQKEQKHSDGCFTCDEYKKGYEEGRRNGFTAGYNKAMKEVEQKEQKPVESISQLSVQGKGVYKICPRCKERMVRDDSMVYTSMPPQYGYECPKCGEMEFDTVMYDNPEIEEQKSVVTHGETYHVDTLGTQQVIAGKMPQKPAEWSEEDRLHYANVLEALEYVKGCKSDYDKIEAVKYDIAWFKSFRPQYYGDVTMTEAYKMGLEVGKASSWKPSEHQMKILKSVKEYVGRGSGYWGEALGSLIEDLEKL